MILLQITRAIWLLVSLAAVYANTVLWRLARQDKRAAMKDERYQHDTFYEVVYERAVRRTFSHLRSHVIFSVAGLISFIDANVIRVRQTSPSDGTVIIIVCLIVAQLSFVRTDFLDLRARRRAITLLPLKAVKRHWWTP